MLHLVLIEKQRARVAVHGQALLDADGMRRQNRPIPADVALRDTVSRFEHHERILMQSSFHSTLEDL